MSMNLILIIILFIGMLLILYKRGLLSFPSKSKTDLTVEGIASFLIDDAGSDVPTPYKEYLNVKKLDYSLDSLKEIDVYLTRVRKNLKKLGDLPYTRLILRCGAYTGEVMRRGNSNLHWILYEEAAKISPTIKDFGKSPFTTYILSDLFRKKFYFPMVKTEKFLRSGRADSLYSMAKACF